MIKKLRVTRREVRFGSGDIEQQQRRTSEVVRWRSRKTGRFVEQRRGAKRETYIYRTLTTGEFETGMIVSKTRVLTKTVTTQNLNEWNGMVRDAMSASNIMSSAAARAAKMVDIKLEGFDGQTKIIIKKSLDLRDITKRQYIGELMVGKIIERLHGMGYRTEYPLEIVKGWTQKQTKRYQSQGYTELQKVKLTFTVRH